MHRPHNTNKDSPLGNEKHSTLRIIIALCLAIFPIALFPSIAQATVVPPTSDPTITTDLIHINRNVVTSGDFVIYAPYTLPYTTIPTIPADQAFIFRLLDSTKTIELGAVTPFAYSEFSNGYIAGDVFFYLTASSSFVWPGTYYIRISENPAQFASPHTPWDYEIPVTAFSSFISQIDNQTEMASNVIYLAKLLQGTFGHTMTQSSASGTVLTAEYGEPYYRGSCPGLQSMSPSLFYVQVLPIDLTSTGWTTIQADTYAARDIATWVGGSTNATATQFGITYQMVWFYILILPLCLGAVAVFGLRPNVRRLEPGLVICAVLLLWAVHDGFVPIPLFASLWQAMCIYTGYLWFLARA